MKQILKGRRSMRSTRTPTSLAVGLGLGLAFAPLAVQAQDPAGADPSQEEQDATETQGADVVDAPAPARTPQGGRSSAPGEVHTVVPGDTLWDVSQRYLGNAWYWPKVWSYNPEIANPHWIYPGNLVRLFPAGEESPSQVEAGPTPVAATELAPSNDLDAPSAFEAADEGQVTVSGKIGFVPKQGRRVVHAGFVTGRELDEAGRIDSSFSEALMMSYPDTVYVKFKNRSGAKLGDRYVVFRTEKEIHHPNTGAKVGYLTKFLGVLRVTQVSEKLVTAQIQETWDEVTRGDLVGPYGEQLAETVTPRANEREVKATVVTALVPYLTLFGEHHELVLDKGRSDGVQQGNTFAIVRQQDLGGNFMNPAKGQNPDLPLEDVAMCLAVDVKDKTTNCLLTRSIREVVPGDRALMRVAPAAPTARR
jgi:LysM repeat protein